MAKFLMSHPEFFTVSYEINSWMNVKNKPDNLEARKQWRRLFQLLVTCGADVNVINGDEQYPDLVFTANAGIVHGNKFIPSNFRHSYRCGESAIFEKWFAENGYEIIRLSDELIYEGNGDILPLGEIYVAGYGFRSSCESHLKLGEILGISIVPVELKNGYFYHLDTCFCPLQNPKDNTPSFIYFDGAFSQESLLKLEALPYTKFAVPEVEALEFACNAIQVNNRIIISEKCEKTAEWLKSIGFKVLMNDISQFKLSGGGNRCMVLKIV